MVNYIVKNKILDPEDLKKFNQAGFVFSEEYSTENEFIFISNK